MKKIRLFCIPFAGGSGMVYNAWKNDLHDGIELCPLELAGRGKRLKEPHYPSFEALVDDLYDSIRDRLDQGPYALFGHSLGTLAVYDLFFRIKDEGLPLPVHLFFSGRRPPSMAKDEPVYHTLSDADLKEKILELGGTPKEMFADESLTRMFLDILRSDFGILHQTGTRPAVRIECPMSVLGGKDDASMPVSELTAWKSLAGLGSRMHRVEGGHFFIRDNADKVVDIINTTLIESM